MARFLLLILFLNTIFSCKNRSEQLVVSTIQKPIIEIPQTLERSYQVISLRNLGVIYEGEHIKGEFYLQLQGDTTITINQIKATCGCMEIIADFETISKGEVVKVGYQIDSNFKEGEEYFDVIFDTSIGLFIVEQKAIVKD